MNCPKCNEEVKDTWKVCPFCAQSLSGLNNIFKSVEKIQENEAKAEVEKPKDLQPDSFLASFLKRVRTPDKSSQIGRDIIRDIFSKKETTISKSTYSGLEFPELKEGDFITLKTGAQLVPIGKFPELPKPKWIEAGHWEVVEFLKQDFIGIHLSNGPIPHEYPCYTRRRWIKLILSDTDAPSFDPWKNPPGMTKEDHEKNNIRQMKDKYNYNWGSVKKED